MLRLMMRRDTYVTCVQVLMVLAPLFIALVFFVFSIVTLIRFETGLSVATIVFFVVGFAFLFAAIAEVTRQYDHDVDKALKAGLPERPRYLDEAS